MTACTLRDNALYYPFNNRRDAFYQEAENRCAMLDARWGERLGCEIELFDLADSSTLAVHLNAADILINATPIGMQATRDAMALPDASLLRADLVVCDLIYVPRTTRLLKTAQAMGCKTVSGIGMQLWQAMPAFRMWTGQEPDVEVARRALFGSSLGEM